eukprot:TRINITY_DN88522_c0_g1_i1.p1 TRINITY_DN88522_c0_g1~~TRINITY_DN88522_c0_g1_i1.p1  ORF type:complete len:659 (-),score=65.36 TRINITY_DN88522_c0_g1_i1:443-2419(-)
MTAKAAESMTTLTTSLPPPPRPVRPILPGDSAMPLALTSPDHCMHQSADVPAVLGRGTTVATPGVDALSSRLEQLPGLIKLVKLPPKIPCDQPSRTEGKQTLQRARFSDYVNQRIGSLGDGDVQSLVPADSEDEAACAFKTGTTLESIGKAIVRKAERLDSAKLHLLPPKSRVDVLKLGSGPHTRRMYVRDRAGLEGWVSSAKEDGQDLWVEINAIERGSALFAVENNTRIFYDIHSWDVIGQLDYGEEVLATGAPQKIDTFMMVPIQVKAGACGAVQLELMQTKKPKPRTHASAKRSEKPFSGPLSLELVYTIPVCDRTAAKIAPRVILYGDGLTGEDNPPYAHQLAKCLASKGLPIELIGCGLTGFTAHHLAAGMKEPVLRDVRKRLGPGLESLVKPQERDARPADLVILTAGMNDILRFVQDYNRVEPGQIADAVQILHGCCHRLGSKTVALGLTDIGGRVASTDTVARRHALNSALARWTRENEREACESERPELFVNPGMLVPYGPLAVKAGLWREGLHLTEEGSRLLGDRLASRLSPLVAKIRAEKILEMGAGDKDSSYVLPVEAYMEALGVHTADPRDACDVVGEWELAAVRRIQLAIREHSDRRRRRKRVRAMPMARRAADGCWKILTALGLQCRCRSWEPERLNSLVQH